MAAAASSSVSDMSMTELYVAVATQKAKIRDLKAAGSGKEVIMPEVSRLKELNAAFKTLTATEGSETVWEVDKESLDNTITRRMFVVPSFEIYNGVAGLFDFGPPGTAFKDNLLNFWKRHFVFEEGMLQLECTTLTPMPVLKTSGHVDRFTDLMVKDTTNGECFRADKLLEDHIEELLRSGTDISPERREDLRKIKAQADAYTPEELGSILADLKVVSPSSGAALSAPFPFNLMFGTSIGPAGDMPGFLRPETAQGMFMNFRRLIEYNGGKVPFAATQIGTAYRNEIAPRNGLLRVREFTMAEIEHFVNPEDKSHAKFASVAGDALTLFTAEAQVTTGKTMQMLVGDAVGASIIDNQTLAYFMARTQRFLVGSGIKPSGLRFRQHLRTEMAHYACDCWDAEILMSAGWIECVGHADRACYDLEVHAKATRVAQEAAERLAEPVTVETLEVKPDKGGLGRRYKKAAKVLLAHLTDLDVEAAKALRLQLEAGPVTLEVDGTEFALTPADVTFKAGTRRMVERKFTPSVIEPSFGIGRIMQGVFEHTFYVREGDADRGVFGFPAIVAPFKAAVLPLEGRIPAELVASIRDSLTAIGLSVITNESSTAIGRKYARADEVGIPFAITIDHESLTNHDVTVRERDSMDQVRVPIAAVPDFIRSLCNNTTTWKEAVARMASPAGAVSGAGAAETAPASATTAAAAAASSAGPPEAPQGASAASGTASSSVPPAALGRSYNLPTTITGTARTDALKLEGTGRAIGRFARPAVPIL